MAERKRITTGSSFESEMAYSRAVVQGDWCFVSGITGYDYETMSLPSGIAEQAENCFSTLSSVLNDAGFEMGDIVRVQYTLPERGDLAQLGPVIQSHLEEVRPAATLVIAGLMQPEMRFEIEATALKRSNNVA